MVYVDFDEDLAAIGAIEPVFVEERSGWYKKQLVIDDESLVATAIMSNDSPEPIAFYYKDLDPPIERNTTVLRWQLVDAPVKYKKSQVELLAYDINQFELQHRELRHRTNQVKRDIYIMSAMLVVTINILLAYILFHIYLRR